MIKNNYYKYIYGKEFDTSSLLVFSEGSWFQILTEQEEGGNLICPICENRYSKHNGKQSDCRKCKIIVVDNQNSGIMFINRTQKKSLMKQRIKLNKPWIEPTRCRTSPEIEEKKVAYMKENNLGVYNKNCPQHSKENIQIMLNAASKPKIRKIVEEKKKINKIGQYSEESKNKSIETRRNNGQIKRAADSGRKTQLLYFKKDELGNYIINTDKAIEFRKSHYIPSPDNSFSINKIISLIEESNFSTLTDVLSLLNRVKKLKNYTKEIENEIRFKAKELGIPTNYREYFYSKCINLILYTSVNNLITNFNSLKGIPGVWRIDGVDGVTYDVAQTQDIGKEMFTYLRRLEFNKNLSEEEIEELNIEKQAYNRKKYRNIMKDCEQVEFVLVARDIVSREERELIEAQEAHDREAKYWSPAPGQFLINLRVN